MISSFDLFSNPFVLLRLDLSASAQEIANAFDDAVADGHASEPELIAARQAILTPLLRLDAEIRILLDTPSREWRSILTALKSSQSLPSLRQAFANVASLSRSNLLVHLASHAPSDAATLTAWVVAQSTINLDEIEREVKNYREIANFVRPDRAALSSALSSLREQQARALFEGFANPVDSIGVVTTCTRDIISSQDTTQIDALGSLLNAYSHYIELELSLRRRQVTAAATALRSNPDEPGALASIVASLRSWDEAGEPLQLLEVHKGRDEPSAQLVFQEARSLAIDIANDLSRFDVALSIITACQEIFTKLPRAQTTLSDDRTTVEERIVSSKIDPLATAIQNLGKDLLDFEGELRTAGFGEASIGSARLVREAFIASVKSSKGSTVADLPWSILRSIVVRLNNKFEASDSALELMKGLLDLANELKPSEDILSRLQDDKRAIERNQLEKDLIKYIKEGRWSEASSAIEILLLDFKSPDERATLQKLKSDIGHKKLFQYLRWGFWPAVILVGIIIIGSNDRSPNTVSRPTFNPPVRTSPETSFNPSTLPPSYSPPQSIPARPVKTFVEEMPPVGSNLNFSEGNIRYCMFQKARVEFIQSRTSNNFEIVEFNRLVDDYNSRCASYRYKRDERSTVEAELLQKRLDINFQADRILSEWRSRQSRLSSSPQTSVPLAAPPPPTASARPAFPAYPPQAPPTSNAPPLPPSISIGEAPKLNVSPVLDLLKFADASRVQGRLTELGYLSGPADGTWGTRSRSALRAFRATNGLPASDAWDVIAAEKLFSKDAVKFFGAPTSYKSLPDATFTAPVGATMNPLNKDDAIRIHSRLRELGLYQGQNLLLWSPASRIALREFKAMNDLPPDEEWDAIVEKRLFSINATRVDETAKARFAISFNGIWAINSGICPAQGVDPNTYPLTITSNRAQAGGASCEFLDIKSEGDRWFIKAQCQSEDNTWAANIILTRIENKLNWSSERGTATYYRCGS